MIHALGSFLLALYLSRPAFWCRPKPEPSPALEEPQDAAALVERANILVWDGRWSEALQDVSAATELDPDHAPAYEARGWIRFCTGDAQGGLTDFEQAIHLEPGCARLYNKRAMVRVSLGQLDDAMADFDRVIELDPNSPDAYTERTDLFWYRVEYEKAIADFTTVYGLRHATKAETCRARAHAHILAHELSKAVADLTECIRLEPDQPGAYWQRFMVYRWQGRYEEAMADLESYVRLTPIDHKSGKAYARKLIEQMRDRM